MKKSVIRIITLVFLVNFCILVNGQANHDSLENGLIANWRIENIIINGIADPDFNPDYEDLIILRKDGTHTTTDKEYEYEQEGQWRLENGMVLVLTSDGGSDIQKMKIILFKNNRIRLKLLNSENDIVIYLVKYDEVL